MKGASGCRQRSQDARAAQLLGCANVGLLENLHELAIMAGDGGDRGFARLLAVTPGHERIPEIGTADGKTDELGRVLRRF